MNCNLTKGRELDGCLTNNGGVKKVYIANFSEVDTVTVGSDDKITDLSLSGTDNNFYKFDVEERAGVTEFNETLQFEIANAAKSYEQQLTLLFNKHENETRDIISALASTSTLLVIKDQNDNEWLMGKDRGAFLANAETGSGAELNARNGSTLTIQAVEPEQMFLLDSSQVDMETKSVYS